jgi:pSer/pThr/pTyr-binding forkhead associated (FHA) protein
MANAIRLTVITGPHKSRRFCFCGQNRCVVGRADDCFIQLAGTARDQLISRHHCQLEVNPPSVQVRDLGSKNGTYVNGRKVGADLQNASTRIGHNVLDGELITVGGTTLSVEIVDCPHAGNGTEGNTGWQNGETLKVDCPLPC